MFAQEIKKRNFTLEDSKEILCKEKWKRVNIMRVNKTRIPEIIACEDYVSIFYFEPFWDDDFVDILLNKVSVQEIQTSSQSLVEILREEFDHTKRGVNFCLSRRRQ